MTLPEWDEHRKRCLICAVAAAEHEAVTGPLGDYPPPIPVRHALGKKSKVGVWLRLVYKLLGNKLLGNKRRKHETCR